MKNIPKKIYLQIGDGCPDDVCFDELSDVTWWDERIFSSDIEYVHGGAWHDAESDDLPEYDREVIVLCDEIPPYYRVCFAHRPDPKGDAQTYGKGWNIENVKWWLDVELPKGKEASYGED